MSGALFFGVFLAVITGVILKLVLDALGTTSRISLVELVIGAAVCSLVVTPIVDTVGARMARGDLLRYSEFWGGYETTAKRDTTPCSRDGQCRREYECDPYTVTEVVSVPDADGKGSHMETVSHTEYHSCPYATEEWSFSVDTTLGSYVIEDHGFSDHPHEWRGGGGIPSDVPRGVPPFWAAAKARIDSGDPGPVAAERRYDNYILASQNSILKRYSGAVGAYRRRRLLPPPVATPARPIHDFYLADKVAFVAWPPGGDLPAWSDAVMRFDAALGAELQGDLHLVVVPAAAVDDPDRYLGALTAYWTGKAFGRRALSKNGIIVVLGVQDGKVGWARGSTGMPLGNEAMLLSVRNGLVGQPFDPTVILGHPIGHVTNGKVTVTHGGGALERIVWGEHRFRRVCMRCAKTHGGGFTYLAGEIQPTSGQRAAILLAGWLVSLLVWGALLVTVIGEDGPLRRKSH